MWDFIKKYLWNYAKIELSIDYILGGFDIVLINRNAEHGLKINIGASLI